MSSRTSIIIIVILFKTWYLNLLLLPGVKNTFNNYCKKHFARYVYELSPNYALASADVCVVSSTLSFLIKSRKKCFLLSK